MRDSGITPVWPVIAKDDIVSGVGKDGMRARINRGEICSSDGGGA
jgi:hypothetical protein